MDIKLKEYDCYEGDPKKGTGKKPKGDHVDDYNTDENPKDTVSV